MADGLKDALVKQLKALLDGGHAHATLEAAVKDFPEKLRGVVPDTLPYSAWQILEHLRIAQRDMLDYSDNADGSYTERSWPNDYWPKEAEPPDATAWDESLLQIHEDRKSFEKLITDAEEAELTASFPWGDGQNLLQEVLQVIDHNAYHVGELVVVRRLLGAWKST